MSFVCHQDNTLEPSNFFGCTSFFMPVEEQEVCPLNDNVPESVKNMEKKNNGIHFLPGEKLLIQLSKQKKKLADRSSSYNTRTILRDQNDLVIQDLNIDRVAASLGKILPF